MSEIEQEKTVETPTQEEEFKPKKEKKKIYFKSLIQEMTFKAIIAAIYVLVSPLLCPKEN